VRKAVVYFGIRELKPDSTPDFIIYPGLRAIDGIDGDYLGGALNEVYLLIDTLDVSLQQMPDYCERHAIVVCDGYRPRLVLQAIQESGWPVTVIDNAPRKRRARRKGGKR
jgi:hypothetical protein